MVVAILDSNELRYLSPHCIITVPDFLGEAQHLPKRFWHVPQSILAKSILNLPCHTEKWMKQIIYQSKFRSYESLHVWVRDSSYFQTFNHPFHKQNWTKQIFPRHWISAVVVAVPSLTAVLPTSQCLARWQREGSKHPSRKRWNWNQETKETQNQTEKQYLGIFFLQWTYAKREGRLKLSGKKLLNLSYPSLSGTLPPSKNCVRRPQRCPQCSPLPNDSDTIIGTKLEPKHQRREEILRETDGKNVNLLR